MHLIKAEIFDDKGETTEIVINLEKITYAKFFKELTLTTYKFKNIWRIAFDNNDTVFHFMERNNEFLFKLLNNAK
jgi:hypothetical protein